MIRKRIPHQDDRVILELVQQLLVPFAKETQPDLRVDMATIRHRLKPCLVFVESISRNKPAGFVSLRLEKDRIYVDMLAVHPKWQGRGVGSKLLEHAERIAMLKGYHEVYLWVDEANVQAQRFYRTKQYQVIHYDTTIRCYFLSKRIQAAKSRSHL